MKKILQEFYDKIKTDTSGLNAQYIKELADVNPELFGVSFCDLHGEITSVGDAEIPFSLQSTCKPLMYMTVLETVPRETIHKHVGHEPSGRAFNEHVLTANGIPHNPMINAGAIMIASLIDPSKQMAERYGMVHNLASRLAGNVANVGFDIRVNQSEMETDHGNRSLSYYMYNAFPKGTDLNKTLSLYYQCCSMQGNCRILSAIAATLANNGVSPVTNRRVVTPETVRDSLTLMFTCGMYDSSGRFAFEVGLPAKSGVSGVVFMVVPGLGGLAVFSPRLDKFGNSVRGVAFCKLIAQRFNSHMFNMDPFLSRVQQKEKSARPDLELIEASAIGDMETVKRIIAQGVDPNCSDYDKRSALHLAAEEGHWDVLDTLVAAGGNLDSLDRFGSSPRVTMTTYRKKVDEVKGAVAPKIAVTKK